MSTFSVVKDSSHSYLKNKEQVHGVHQLTEPQEKKQTNSNTKQDVTNGFERAPVGATLTNLLVGKGASQHLAEHRWVSQGFQGLVQTVHQRVEELQSIVLLPQIHRLAP